MSGRKATAATGEPPDQILPAVLGADPDILER
jgi:hypothetical protein